MPDAGWRQASIAECLASQFPGEWGAAPAQGGNATVLRSTDIDDAGHIDLETGARRTIPTSKLNSKRLRGGDILLEASGGGPGKPVGRVALFRGGEGDTYICSNFFRTLRPRTTLVDPSFLAWRLQHVYAQPSIWVFQQQTTGIINLKFRDYSARRVDVPPLPEQRQIAEILDTLDEAIRKTEAIIAKLKQVKQGLLHDLLTRGIDDNDELRDPERHPEQFKDSPLGRIPKEWGVVRVEDAGDVQLGRQRSPATASGSHLVPYLRVANVFDGYIDYSDVLRMNFTPAEQETYSVLPGDILLNEGQSLELVGRSALYEGEPHAHCFQNTLIRFRAATKTRPRFARHVFKYWLDTGRFIPVAKQTTSVAHLGAGRFASMPFPLPGQREQAAIEAGLDAIDEVLAGESAALRKRRLLKQGLMDDLLTGRVRVTKLLDEAAE